MQYSKRLKDENFPKLNNMKIQIQKERVLKTIDLNHLISEAYFSTAKVLRSRLVCLLCFKDKKTEA